MQYFTVEQACLALRVNPRTLRKWVDEQGMEWQTDPADKRVRRLDEEQLQMLAGHYGRVIRELMSQDALYARIAELEEELARLKARPIVSALMQVQSQSDAPISKKGAARLADEHGAKFNTAEKWPWPVESRQTRQTVVLYVYSRMGGETRRNWRECEGHPDCSCHRVDELQKGG
jgi:uncharacterized small protein (DUF1192 family)